MQRLNDIDRNLIDPVITMVYKATFSAYTTMYGVSLEQLFNFFALDLCATDILFQHNPLNFKKNNKKKRQSLGSVRKLNKNVKRMPVMATEMYADCNIYKMSITRSRDISKP